jgi:hypothetical protein
MIIVILISYKRDLLSRIRVLLDGVRIEWLGFNTAVETTSNFRATAILHTLQFTAANTSVLSLLQSSLAVFLQRILTQEL